MLDFTFETTPRVVCEMGAATRLPELCAELGGTRVLIVTDPGLRKAGLLDVPLAAFEKAGDCRHTL